MAIEVPEQEETTSQQLMEVELTDLKEEPLNSTVDSESFEQTDMGSAIDLTLQGNVSFFCLKLNLISIFKNIRNFLR